VFDPVFTIACESEAKLKPGQKKPGAQENKRRKQKYL